MRSTTSGTPDRGTYPVGDSIRQELNTLIQDFNYFVEHHIVASGAIARGTTASKVKTAAIAGYLVGGDLKTKAATDDLFVLGVAGSNTNVAIGFAQKYLLMLDAAGAATVQEGIQALTLAAVTFAARPPIGKTVIGVLSVTNATNVFIPGTTLLSAAGVVDTYENGLDNTCLQALTLDR